MAVDKSAWIKACQGPINTDDVINQNGVDSGILR